MIKELKADLLRISTQKKWWITFFLEFIKPSPFKAILCYRISHYFYLKKFVFPAVLFETLVKWRYASDIRRNATIGGGIILPHPYGIVIGGYSKIGQNCHIGQHVTIGGNMGKQKNGQTQPVIGNDCFICANSIVVSPITIGDNVIIGAGSVVIHDIPSNVVAAGNPCRIIKQRTP